MANATVNVPVDISNIVKSTEPYVVFKTEALTEYRLSGDVVKAYGKISSMPRNLRHNVLIGFSCTLYLRTVNPGQSTGNAGVEIRYAKNDFDPDTLTYNNAPASPVDGNVTTVWRRLTPTQESAGDISSGYIQNPGKISVVLSRRALIFYDYTSSGVFYAYIKKELADGESLPYFTITYDDATKIRSKISYNNSQLTGTINPGVAKTLTWDLIKDISYVTGYCAEEVWDQVSAVFSYRVQGQSEWQTKSVSGNTKSITLPAYTFSTGQTYEYQITVTDEDGTVSSTNVYTVTADATKVTPTNAPTSGYANPRNPISFGWVYQTSSGAAGAGDTSLFWRVAGSGTWTEVQAAHGANSVTIPANTFPVASTIQWYLSGTDASGYASQTSVYSFSTAAGTITSTAVSPSNSIQSNNQPMTFRWTYSSPDGFAPTRYKFLWKLATDADWTTLLDETTVVKEYTFPAYTFPAGEIRWMVVLYNIDGVSGTGNSASFICYGAPDAPVVYATEVPFSTVSWQASDQQAYKIKVDDRIYGPYFGADKSFDLPYLLEDGEHTIGVSAVGTYALWSEWGEAVINVQNVPGDEIVLGGVGGIDAFLSWVTAEETSDFMVFRDDVQIARTAGITFTDRFATGEHTYKVINRLPNGNYSESNEVTMDMDIDGTYIALLSGGDWLKIKYMLKDQSDPQYEDAIETTYNHLAGSEYPSVVISRYRNRTVSYSAVFLFNQDGERKTFESMFKQPVIIKFKDGTVFVGVLDSWSKKPVKEYYTSYTFSVTQADFEDYVDDTT